MKFALALIALTAAQDQGYGGQAEESYSAPTTAYSAPSYEAAAAPAYVTAPKCCVHECPSHAPFFSVTQCGCLAGVQYAVPSYETHYHESYEQPTYAQESSGYRQLQNVGHAPAGTIDTRRNQVGTSGRVSLWVGFIILFLCGWTFINRALRFHFYGNHVDLNCRQLAFLSGPGILAGFVCLIAALAYLTMATGNGFYTRCSDGRSFYFARYIDWVITTPIILHILVHFAGGSDDTFIYLFFMDILMIVSGLIGSVTETSDKWFFFGFAIFTFLPVIYYICWLRNKVVNPKFDYALFFWNYSTMANLTAIVWFIYPIVWVIAEGVGVLSADGEAIFYTVLDIIAKCLLGFFIITARSIHQCVDGDCTTLEKALEKYAQ